MWRKNNGCREDEKENGKRRRVTTDGTEGGRVKGGRGRDSKALDGRERGGRAENEERDTKTGVVAAVHTSS